MAKLGFDVFLYENAKEVRVSEGDEGLRFTLVEGKISVFLDGFKFPLTLTTKPGKYCGDCFLSADPKQYRPEVTVSLFQAEDYEPPHGTLKTDGWSLTYNERSRSGVRTDFTELVFSLTEDQYKSLSKWFSNA